MSRLFRFSKIKHSKGQAMLELALTLPIFMLLIVGVIEMGYFLETLWRITDAGTIRHHSIAIAWLNLHNKHQPSMGLKD